ncbi:MAG: nitroreductase family protein [Candidatus Omnitrophota bacterium]|jgi:nitroreductase
MKMCIALSILVLASILIIPKIVWANETLDVIHSRKSVRSYTDQPVSKEDIEALLKAGMAAPSARDTRPWAFVVVTQKEKLSKLADSLPNGKMLKSAQAAIVVCGRFDKTLANIAEGYWVQDCSAASENILLAAESIKLGAVWCGVYPNGERVNAVRNILDIPDQVMPLNVISIGYPTGAERPKDKFDAANIHWERW